MYCSLCLRSISDLTTEANVPSHGRGQRRSVICLAAERTQAPFPGRQVGVWRGKVKLIIVRKFVCHLTTTCLHTERQTPTLREDSPCQASGEAHLHPLLCLTVLSLLQSMFSFWRTQDSGRPHPTRGSLASLPPPSLLSRSTVQLRTASEVLSRSI